MSRATGASRPSQHRRASRPPQRLPGVADAPGQVPATMPAAADTPATIGVQSGVAPIMVKDHPVLQKLFKTRTGELQSPLQCLLLTYLTSFVAVAPFFRTMPFTHWLVLRTRTSLHT